MSDEQVRIMRLLMENDFEKIRIDKKIQTHTGSNSDLIELLVLKGGVVGKIKVLNELIPKINIKS